MSDLMHRKKEMRLHASSRRFIAHRVMADTAGLKLAAAAMPVEAKPDANVISGFYPYQDEIDVLPLLGKLAGEGWTTSLPVVIAKGQPLQFRRWYPGEPTIIGKWDIPRPDDAAPVVEPDVLLVPMLAFDRQGYRLGYGGGFYDRTLAQLRAKKGVVAIGVAYGGQEVDAVPHDGQDQPLDYVLTENEVFSCA